LICLKEKRRIKLEFEKGVDGRSRRREGCFLFVLHIFLLDHHHRIPIMDPHRVLPEEAFLVFFKFTTISDTANASSVNRSWRESIEKDPSLHRVINLIGTKRKCQKPTYILNHLERFSKLSLNRLEDIRLEFSPFWNDLIVWSPKNTNLDAAPCFELFNLIRLSRTSLKSIHLQVDTSIDRYLPLKEHSNLDSLITHLSKDYPNLEKVNLSMPSPIKFKSSSNLESRSFSVGGLKSFPSKRNPRAWASWIRKATGFTGGGLDSFTLHTENIEKPRDDETDDVISGFMELMDQVKESKETLEKLEVNTSNTYFMADFYGHQILDLIFECSNTSSLKLSLFEMEEFEIPDSHHSETQFKHLQLNFDRVSLVWNETFTNWIGRSLETFKFKYEELIPARSFFSLVISNKNLKTLELSSFEFEENDSEIEKLITRNDHLNPLRITFNNLERLSLKKIPLLLMIFFTKLSLPQLKDLEVGMASKGFIGESFSYMHVLDFLRCHSSIKRLSLSNINTLETKNLHEHWLPIPLPNLEQVVLKNVSYQVSDMVCKSDSSKLKSVSIHQCSGINRNNIVKLVRPSLETLKKLELTASTLMGIEENEEIVLFFPVLEELSLKESSLKT
jgi:hypothetical protein